MGGGNIKFLNYGINPFLLLPPSVLHISLSTICFFDSLFLRRSSPISGESEISGEHPLFIHTLHSFDWFCFDTRVLSCFWIIWVFLTHMIVMIKSKIKQIRIYFQMEFTIHRINYLLSFLNQRKKMIANGFNHIFICSVLQLKWEMSLLMHVL